MTTKPDRCSAREVMPPHKSGTVANIPVRCTLPAGHEGPHMQRLTTAPAIPLREPIELADKARTPEIER